MYKKRLEGRAGGTALMAGGFREEGQRGSASLGISASSFHLDESAALDWDCQVSALQSVLPGPFILLQLPLAPFTSLLVLCPPCLRPSAGVGSSESLCPHPHSCAGQTLLSQPSLLMS